MREKIKIVMVYASWCGHCQRAKPVFEEISMMKKDKFDFSLIEVEEVEKLKELGIDSKRLLVWIKNNQSTTPKNAFNKVTEFITYGTIGRPWLNDKIKNLNEIQNKEVSTGNRLIEDILDLLNIWLVKRLAGSEMEHPTQKSPTVHEKILRRCTRPGDIVLDLTAGSGSILSACEQMKRTAYCCEIEPIFCQLIINKFSKLNPNEKITKLN